MNTETFPSRFDPTASVIFLGAGFSREAKNVLLEAPPSVWELESRLKDMCGLPKGDPAGLMDLATYAVAQDKGLYQSLSSWFTIKEVGQNQKAILSQPWLRIYTTNYDDAVEVYWRKNNVLPKPTAFTLGDAVPRKIPKVCIIHLHGYIHRCTSENVLSQLVLNHRSYAEQRATTSPWWDQFERDLRVCQNIFFVGYQLNDFEPASYLTKNPATAGRTHFILLPETSPVMASRLEGYGTRHSFGVEGFASECLRSVQVAKPAANTSLTSFHYFDTNKDRKSVALPSSEDVEALYSFGIKDHQKFISTFPALEYVLPRNAALREAISALEHSKTLLIHSKIGNGKSVFADSLAFLLTRDGYTCFFSKESSQPLTSDIEYLSDTKKVAVFFRSYEQAYNVIQMMSHLRDDAKFIIEIGTGTLQVRYREVMDRLIIPVGRINLNFLSKSDLNDLSIILDNAGILPPDFRNRFHDDSEFRDIVLSIFENPHVKARVDANLLPLMSNAKAKAVLVTTALAKAIGTSMAPSFIHSLINVDAYDVLTSLGENAFEIVDFSHDRIEPHSAIFSEFLVEVYLESFEIVAAIFNIASEAARRREEEVDQQSERAREARAILGGIMRFGFLQRLLQRSANRDSAIKKLYEAFRRDNLIQREPLFWLQYSIYMQNSDRYDLAEKYMETAYLRAYEKPGFRTYQLDTNSLGLYLDIEARSSNATVVRFEKIASLMGIVREMLDEGNHREHALTVLKKAGRFVDSCLNKFSRSEATTFTYHLSLTIATLSDMKISDRLFHGSDEVKFELQRAYDKLTT